MITNAMKNRYIQSIHAEMLMRGFLSEEIPLIIAKTPFEEVMREYPEEQMHYAPSDAVNEILACIARNSVRSSI